MPVTTFEEILNRAIRSGKVGGKESLDWFSETVRYTRLATPERLIREERARMTTQPLNGRLYAFFYNPKHKNTLPYYDRFPMMFKVKRLPEGFLGINFHYLHYRQRAVLMDALYDLATDDKLNEETRLRLSYNVLNKNAAFKLFRPALKRYLTRFVESRFVEILPSNWNSAIMLPVARFEKAENRRIWRNSQNAI